MVDITKTVDMSIDLNGFKMQNPILAASGTFGYSLEYGRFVDVKSLGGIVTKAITLEPRDGNNWRRLFETDSGMINSIGLENVGVEKFMSEKIPFMEKAGLNYIVNLAGSSMGEYVKLAQVCEKNKIKAVELNVSCPNVKYGCLEFGTDPNTLHSLVSQIRDEFSGFLIVKLTPNVTEIEKIAAAAQSAGANCISAINTVKGMGVKLTWNKGKFMKESVQGGLSGRAIKPIALAMINRISKVIDIPIIGMGGIYTLDDIFEFMAVGADAVQIGTANFTHPTVSEELVKELHDFMYENDIRSMSELKEKLRGE